MSRSPSSMARRYSNPDLDSSRVTRSSSGTPSTSGGRSSGRARLTHGAVGLSGRALRLETADLGVERGGGICTLLAGPLAVGIEPLDLEDPPLPHQRHDEVLVVDSQIADPGLRQLRSLEFDAGDDAARHLERD